MRAIVLAAGRGERMRPLTDVTPKPLLEVAGRALIAWQIDRLVAAGVNDIVINVSHLGVQIERALGDGGAFGARIAFSRESSALETAGGIALARPMLGTEAFLAVNADVYCEYDLRRLVDAGRRLQSAERAAQAHVVLVPNPEHNSRGDFDLDPHGRVAVGPERPYTFSGLAVYRPDFFDGVEAGERRPLGPMLREAASRGGLAGERFDGLWTDVGTPERLESLRRLLRARS